MLSKIFLKAFWLVALEVFAIFMIVETRGKNNFYPWLFLCLGIAYLVAFVFDVVKLVKQKDGNTDTEGR